MGFRKSSLVVFVGFPLVVVASMAIGTEVAVGWNSNGSTCHFGSSQDDDGLGIGFNPYSLEANRAYNTLQAAIGWNGRVSSQWTYVDYGSTQQDVRVEFLYAGIGAYNAQTLWFCGYFPGSSYVNDPEIYWNLSRSAPYGGNGVAAGYKYEVAVGVHELGHAYGLAHTSVLGCIEGWNVGMMISGGVFQKVDQCLWWDRPHDDDTNGWSYVHP